MLPHRKWSMTKVGGAWKIREWKERKVCPGPSAETQRDQLRWRGWMRPFTGPNERVPAGPWMRVGPSAPHRRAQTSDLENYPGSTLGQSPQQQAGVHIVTRRFNQCLAASWTEQSFLCIERTLCEINFEGHPPVFFSKGGGASNECPMWKRPGALTIFERCGMLPSGLFLSGHKDLFVLAKYVHALPERICSAVTRLIRFRGCIE